MYPITHPFTLSYLCSPNCTRTVGRTFGVEGCYIHIDVGLMLLFCCGRFPKTLKCRIYNESDSPRLFLYVLIKVKPPRKTVRSRGIGGCFRHAYDHKQQILQQHAGQHPVRQTQGDSPRYDKLRPLLGSCRFLPLFRLFQVTSRIGRCFRNKDSGRHQHRWHIPQSQQSPADAGRRREGQEGL